MKSGFLPVYIVAAILLLIAMFPLPYGYFTFLRLTVTAAASLWCWTAYSKDRSVGFNVILAGAIAVLFNPVVPVHLSRDLWQPIDVLAACCFFWKAYTEWKA